MHHRPRKRFGQNFLQSQVIISSIMEALCLQATDKVVEIGPGLGALTQPLLDSVERLSAIEIDRDLSSYLQALPNASARLNLIIGDALSYDYQQFGKNIRLIGNLPYNISTPLLFHLLQFAECIQDMHFMLQKEVVNRLVAVPSTKDFGRLSVMMQYYCAVETILDVPATAFYPQPKVTSAVVRLVPYRTSPWPVVPWLNLERLVACAFRMRRKTLANNLKPLLSAEQMLSVDIDPALRPEQLSVAQYGLLTTLIPDQTDTGAQHVLPRRKKIRAQ